jgi:hypothetical protein
METMREEDAMRVFCDRLLRSGRLANEDSVLERLRRIAAWVLLIGGMVMFAYRTTLAVGAARNWLNWHLIDPSGAELYAIDFWVEAAFAVVGGAVAGLGLRVARRAQADSRQDN